MFQLSNLKQLINVIREIDPDIIHGQSGSVFPLSSFLQNVFPLIVTFHTSPSIQRTFSTYSLLRGGSWRDFLTYTIGYPAWALTFKKELEWSTLSVAVSKNLKSDLLNEMGVVYDEKIHVVYNGVDIESLDKDYQKEEPLKELDNIILFAGRLFWSKGSLALVKLAYLLQKENLNFRIIVHGEGPLLKKIKSRIVALKLTNIELKGFANRQQLMRSMRLCRFILIPSFYEACPMILLEGMCLGKIPLMFDLPYAREFTKNGEYGILATNVEDMVFKIKTLQQDHLINLEQRIRCYARMKYNINVVAQKYYHLYKIISDSCD